MAHAHLSRKPTQSNHESWSVPLCLAYLGEMPLYLSVAWWGLRNQAPMTRHDVSEAFHISLRRAAYALTYICQSGHIACERHLTISAGGYRQLSVRVLRIDGKSSLPSPKKTARLQPKPTAQASRDEDARERQSWRDILFMRKSLESV